jgi:methionine synthase II (cobalamin-independent)
MERFCAEYHITVKVFDVMITSDETPEEVKEKIKKAG